MNRATASLPLYLLPSLLFLASPALAQEEAPPSEPPREHRLEDLGKHFEEVLGRLLEQVGRSIEVPFDPTAAAEEARERFGFTPEETERARALLAGARDAHVAQREQNPHDQTDAFRDRAIEAFGPERGKKFAAWAAESHEAAAEKLRRALEPFGRDVGRSAQELAARIVDAVVPVARGEAAEAAHLSEAVAHDVLEQVHRALMDLHIPAPDEDSGEPQEPRRRSPRNATSRPSLVPERAAIERATREALRQAERARAEAERAVRAALERAGRGDHPDQEAHEAMRREVEEAQRRLHEAHGEGARVHEEAVRRAMEEAARHAEEISRRARRSADEGIEAFHKGLEQSARRRALEIERSTRDAMRSRRESEGEELRRAREELERLRRRVEELERRLEERGRSREPRSSV